MSILRQYIAPLIAIIIFFIALAATSARIFLPSDMLAPAPVDGMGFYEDGQNSQLVSLSAPSIESSIKY